MLNQQYILALDQGTSSSRAVIFDNQAYKLGFLQKEIQQIFPKPAWVEHNPIEIWQSQISVAKELLQELQIDAYQIAAIGITNQRETTILWDKKTGKPVYNAIVWQDRRTVELCEAIKKSYIANYIHQNTGLIPDAYFSATKIKWILDNVPEAKELLKQNRLAFGTVDSWLLWNLSGNKIHKTDYSNASRTMLFNIQKKCWDDKILDYFEIPKSILPEVCDSSHNFGFTANEIFNNNEIPITGIAGDQQASLFGHLCFDEGSAKNTYGTGCFLLMNAGEDLHIPSNGLIATIAWSLNGKITYALEGSVFIGGAVVQWLRDNIKIIDNAEKSEELAISIDNNAGVYFVPAFSGLGTPYWKTDAKGIICGLTRKTSNAEISRAALESIAYQVFDVIKAMEIDLGKQLKTLYVDGGATNNNFLMQFQADILNISVIKNNNAETTALGAALLAGLGANIWTICDLKLMFENIISFNPKMSDLERQKNLNGWKDAINLIIQ